MRLDGTKGPLAVNPYSFAAEIDIFERSRKAYVDSTQQDLKFYSVSEVAKILKVHKNLVYEAIRRGHLSAIRLNGRFSSYRIEAGDLAEFAARSKAVPYRGVEDLHRDLGQREETAARLEARFGAANG